MHTLYTRINTGLLVFIALTGVVLVTMMATRAYGGPLDPPGPVASTQSNVVYQPASCAGFPIVISTPGSYRLGGNIAGCTGKDGIQITTGNVTLDLAGFTVSGVPGSLAGIKNVGANSKLSIANGILTSWGVAGIDMAGSSTARLDNLIAAYNTGNGFELGGTNTLSHSSATANSGNGISSSVSATNVTIVDCNADYNTLRGISALGPAAVIDGCTVGNNSGDGIRVGTLAKVTNNDVHNNGGIGVNADHSCMIEHNVSQWNGSWGFKVQPPGNCSVIGNKATANVWGFFMRLPEA
jgi:hypothetical protein